MEHVLLMNVIANVSSGFAGAVIGAFVVWFVSYRERLYSAKNRLRQLLLRNGYSIWWGEDNKEPWQIIEANYIEIHAEYLALRNLVFFGSKRRLEKAWITYTGVDHYRDIPEGDPSKIFAKSGASRGQAISRIISFLQALE